MRRQDPSGVRTWYVRCIGEHTNGAVRRLVEIGNFHEKKKCHDGVRRDLCEVTDEAYRVIMASITDAHLKIEVYFSRSEGEAPLRHHFEKPSTSASKKVAQMIAKRKAPVA
ncbi:MAG: hypothetical protein V4465_02900 [Patescibacteria group bacterium]